MLLTRAAHAGHLRARRRLLPPRHAHHAEPDEQVCAFIHSNTSDTMESIGIVCALVTRSIHARDLFRRTLQSIRVARNGGTEEVMCGLWCDCELSSDVFLFDEGF